MAKHTLASDLDQDLPIVWRICLFRTQLPSLDRLEPLRRHRLTPPSPPSLRSTPVTGVHLMCGRERLGRATTRRTGSPLRDLGLEGGRVAVRIDRERDNEDQPPDDWRECDDATVVAGMRRGWDQAYAEFFDRYTLLLTRLAQRRGLPVGARMELVLEFLDDMALRLGRSVLPVPRDLAGYLAASFRHRMALHWRNEERQARRLDGLLSDTGAGGGARGGRVALGVRGALDGERRSTQQ